MIDVGQPAPDFALADESGVTRQLADYRGKSVVIFFYPKDDTPGCTIEACAFRDDHEKFTNANAVIIGISPDDPASHTQFIEKFGLPFTLLADVRDEEGTAPVCMQYGVWDEQTWDGKTFMGVSRTTYLVDPDGIVAQRWDDVQVNGHSAEVFACLPS